jgi:hypothetical protein
MLNKLSCSLTDNKKPDISLELSESASSVKNIWKEWAIRGCKPEPPKILSENTVGAFPAIYTIRHCFQHTFYPALTAIISQWSLVTENKCLASQVTIADFARMPEISGVPAYIP